MPRRAARPAARAARRARPARAHHRPSLSHQDRVAQPLVDERPSLRRCRLIGRALRSGGCTSCQATAASDETRAAGVARRVPGDDAHEPEARRGNRDSPAAARPAWAPHADPSQRRTGSLDPDERRGLHEPDPRRHRVDRERAASETVPKTSVAPTSASYSPSRACRPAAPAPDEAGCRPARAARRTSVATYAPSRRMRSPPAPALQLEARTRPVGPAVAVRRERAAAAARGPKCAHVDGTEPRASCRRRPARRSRSGRGRRGAEAVELKLCSPARRLVAREPRDLLPTASLGRGHGRRRRER